MTTTEKTLAQTAPPAPPPVSVAPPPELPTVATALPLSRFAPAEQKMNTWHLRLPRGANWNCIHHPNSWVAIGARINIGDLCWITNDEADRLCLYYVRNYACGHFVDLVSLIDKRIDVAKTNTSVQAAPGWYVEYKGAHLRWCIYNHVGLLVRDSIMTRESAVAVMNQLSLNGMRVPQQIIGN